MARDAQGDKLAEPAPEGGGTPRPLRLGTRVRRRARGAPSPLRPGVSAEVGPGAGSKLEGGRGRLGTRFGAAFAGWSPFVVRR